jgi:nucleotide-binding universal stress UspA family protein
MLIRKILLPVDYPNISLAVIRQAATLARHFQSEIVILQVETPRGPAIAGGDVLVEIIGRARKDQDHALASELHGLAIRPVLIKGDATRAIVETAQRENADLIMMPSHGHTFSHFLLGSVAAKTLQGTECPVWTGAHVQESHLPEFAIRSVLCAVDFNSHNRKTVSWADQMAAEFAARLTLVHVTPGAFLWGPGGGYVQPRWKRELFNDASQQIANLQQSMGIKAPVLIGSGDPPKVLSQAVKQTKADLLVTGVNPYGGNLRIHGYAIICAVSVPVLSV